MVLRVRKFFIAALILYWPIIFFLAHVPQVPTWILRAQMSDKTLHFLGYLVLVFLWWFSIFPSRRPSIFHSSLWFTIAMMLVYAAADEWLQRFAHRTPDVMDFVADMAGVFTGLIIFAAAGLQVSAIVVTALVIFILTSLSKMDPLGFAPRADIIFYFCAYGFLTVLWISYLKSKINFELLVFKVWSFFMPGILLTLALAVASAKGKTFEAERIVAAVAGITVPVIIAAFAAAFYKMKKPQLR